MNTPGPNLKTAQFVPQREDVIGGILGLAENYATKILTTNNPQQKADATTRFLNFVAEYGFPEELTQRIIEHAQEIVNNDTIDPPTLNASNHSNFKRLAQHQSSGSNVLHQDDQTLILENPDSSLDYFVRSDDWQPQTIRIGNKGYRFVRSINPEEAQAVISAQPLGEPNEETQSVV